MSFQCHDRGRQRRDLTSLVVDLVGEPDQLRMKRIAATAAPMTITAPTAYAIDIRTSGLVSMFTCGGAAGTEALKTNDPFTQRPPSALHRFTKPAIFLPLSLNR